MRHSDFGSLFLTTLDQILRTGPGFSFLSPSPQFFITMQISVLALASPSPIKSVPDRPKVAAKRSTVTGPNRTKVPGRGPTSVYTHRVSFTRLGSLLRIQGECSGDTQGGEKLPWNKIVQDFRQASFDILDKKR